MEVPCPMCRTLSSNDHLIACLIGFLRNPTCPLCGFCSGDVKLLSEHLAAHVDYAGTLTDDVVGVVDVVDGQQNHRQDCAVVNGGSPAASASVADSGGRKHICTDCGKSFKVRASLTLHRKIGHSKASIFRCQICHKVLSTAKRKEEHERSHCPGNKQCATEDSTCPNKSLQDSSVRTQDEPRSFVCNICDKVFKKDQYLQQHIRTHDMKKWQCDICSKLFTTKEYLRKHARLHTGETPYTCNLCNKSFTFQQSYHKHLLYHSDERPYNCDHCGRHFKELSTLHNHQRIHTGEKPYSCETCGKSFRQRVSYVVHRRIHTGALPYVCTLCGKSFRYKVSQRSHKCAPAREQSGSAVVRSRSFWLERLVCAQQAENDPTTTAVTNDPPRSNHHEQGSDDHDMTEDIFNKLVMDEPIKTNYYTNDPLPTIDLSQLTLSLDSELIFP